MTNIPEVIESSTWACSGKLIWTVLKQTGGTKRKRKLSVKRSFSILDCGGCITVHEYAGGRYGEHVLSLSGVCHHRRGGPSPKNLMHGDIPRDRIRDTKRVTATWHSGSTPRYVLCR